MTPNHPDVPKWPYAEEDDGHEPGGVLVCCLALAIVACTPVAALALVIWWAA